MSDSNYIVLNLYKPKTLDINVRLPKSWNVLEPCELHYISESIIKGRNQNDIAVFILKNRAKESRLPKNWVKLLEHENCYRELSPWIDGLIERFDLTNQPFPVLKHFGFKKFGPDDQFKDLTCGEFEDVEKHFVKYCTSKDVTHLRHIVETLWRSKKNGVRKPYNSSKSKISSFSRSCSAVSLHTLYIWYSSCRSYLPKLFPNLHEGEPPAKGQAPDLMVFTRLIHEGAGAKNGTRDQIRKTFLLEFLYECELSIKKAKELEAATKK